MISKWRRRVIAWGQRVRVRFPFLSWTSLRGAYKFAQLIEIVRILRGSHGCPWDQKQRLVDTLPYLREEALEVLVAGHQVDVQGGDALVEELGDLSFVILFLARLLEERGDSDIADVLGSIVAKMVRRHPHVFADAARDKAAIKQTWQQIKAQERAQVERSDNRSGEKPNGVSGRPAFRSILDGVHHSLSALHDALEISSKVVKVGFEWPDVWEVWAKLEEELGELREVMPVPGEALDQDAPSEAREGEAAARQLRQRDELGDVLFTLVNLGRHLGIDSEEALRAQCIRFVRRFRYVEEALYEQGKTLEETPLEALEALWQEGKRAVG